MIRAHFYHTQEAVLEGITQQLFKHIDTTRFIADPHHSCDDFFYQGVFLHQEGVQFALALSGGETTRKLFTHWRKQHLSNQAWNSIDYYWIDECHTPYINKESNFGEAYRRFFQHSNINPSRIHPIHYTPQPQEEIERYASQLPHSRGLYYDPTRYYTNDYPCIAPYQSHFHCAILDIDDNGQITPLLNNTTTPVPTTPYHLLQYPQTRQKHIAATVQTIRETPRIILPLIGKEKAQIITDLYHQHNTHLPHIQLLMEHPNVHIFTDNKELETLIYPNRKYVQTTPDTIHL